MKNRIAKILAKPVSKSIQKWSQNPEKAQSKIFQKLLKTGMKTAFGKDYYFSDIQSYQDYKQAVPILEYEEIRPYVNRILKGEKNVLWKNLPLYLAKTSGTTSGVKYIPISKESMPFHIKSARNALFSYVMETGKSNFLNGKMIFLQGSPKLEQKHGIGIGRLSGISANHVPNYLHRNRLPSYQTNCIDDWETKLDAIIKETQTQDMRLISGIPPWIQMYFEKLINKTQKPIAELFPNFNLMVTGGVNYEPYRNKMQELIGKKIDVVQTYPASEGFIAYQDSQEDESLLLLQNHGIFYEFIPVNDFYSKNPTRISIESVELNKDYVLILNTNAGLWAYNIGDTIRFTQKYPHKILVTGRIKHFISAFGEHVISHEVEKALQLAIARNYCRVVEFSVAPNINPIEGLPHHQWFIEFDLEPNNFKQFQQDLDTEMCKLNIYYRDLIQGKVLQPLRIKKVIKNGFHNFMKSQGKLGGQNKVPRLKNDRSLVESLEWIQQ